MKTIEGERFFICRFAMKETINYTTGERALVKKKIATCGVFNDYFEIKHFYNSGGEYIETDLIHCNNEPDMVLNVSVYNAKDRNAEHKTFLFKKR